MVHSTKNYPRIVLYEEIQLYWISKTFRSFFTENILLRAEPLSSSRYSSLRVVHRITILWNLRKLTNIVLKKEPALKKSYPRVTTFPFFLTAFWYSLFNKFDKNNGI